MNFNANLNRYVKRIRGKSPSDIARLIKQKEEFYCRRIFNLVREHRHVSWVPDKNFLYYLIKKDIRKEIESVETMISILENRLKRMFFPGTIDKNFRNLFEKNYQREKESIYNISTKLAKGQVTLFRSYKVDLGENINWHSTIINENQWPELYFRKIDIQESVKKGDLRTTWELNRHLHWLTLGKAYFLTKDENYYNTFWSQFESWTRTNPFLKGVNWLSTMEVAIRLNHWLSAYSLLCDCQKFDTNAKVTFFCWVYLHIHYIIYHLTSEDRGFHNNHLIIEAASLYIGSLIFHEFKFSSNQLRKSKKILSDELESQFLKDGFHEELCSSYHLQVTEAYLFSAIATERCGYDIPKNWKEGIIRLTNAIKDIAKPDGKLPLIGDGDDGTFIAVDTNREFLNGKTIADNVSILFPENHISFNDGILSEGAYWIHGPKYLYKKKQIFSLDNCMVNRVLDIAQFAAYKECVNNNYSYCLFSAGTERPSRNNGHRHADLLSVNLNVSNNDILVDPGTYCYNGPLEWRRYFQSTKAHNTITINGKDQFAFRGHFGLQEINYESHMSTWCGDGITIFMGAYTDNLRGAWHCRYIFIMLPEFILIRDSCGEREYADAQLNYTFSPKNIVSLENNQLKCEIENAYKYNLDIFSNNYTFGDKGLMLDKWFSHSYWVKEKCPSVSMNSNDKINTFSSIFDFLKGGSYMCNSINSNYNNNYKESFEFFYREKIVHINIDDEDLLNTNNFKKMSTCNVTIESTSKKQQVWFDKRTNKFLSVYL